jgi:crossover junction endodeoxyribonuclease RuvC
MTDKIILGIDPGTKIMGYALIKILGNKIKLLQYGVIKLEKFKDHHLRLKKIQERVTEIIEEYLPDEMAIEAQFYGKNVQAMLKLGRAQGVAIAACLRKNIPVVEYAPKKVKQSITGNGNASKEQVADMIIREMGIKQKEEFYLDATDAIAVAMCHHFQKGINERSTKSWSKFVEENQGRIKGLK